MKLRAIEHAYRMEAPGTFKGATRTDRKCYNCDEGTFLDLGTELVCDTCSYAPDGRPSIEMPDPWERFWEERKNYSGFTGPGRVRMVGGFIGAY